MKIRSKPFLIVLSLIILVGCSRSGDFQYYLKNVSFKEHDRHLKNVEPNFEGPKFADDGHLLVPGTGMAIVFYDDNLEGNKEQSSFRKLTLVNSNFCCQFIPKPIYH